MKIRVIWLASFIITFSSLPVLGETIRIPADHSTIQEGLDADRH